MPEQQNIEYKSSWHDDYLKWILRTLYAVQVCGFANAQGGRIYTCTLYEVRVSERTIPAKPLA